MLNRKKAVVSLLGPPPLPTANVLCLVRCCNVCTLSTSGLGGCYDMRSRGAYVNGVFDLMSRGAYVNAMFVKLHLG